MIRLKPAITGQSVDKAIIRRDGEFVSSFRVLDINSHLSRVRVHQPTPVLVNGQECLARRCEPRDLAFRRNVRDVSAIGGVKDKNVLGVRDHGEFGSTGKCTQSPAWFGQTYAETVSPSGWVKGANRAVADEDKRLAISGEYDGPVIRRLELPVVVQERDTDAGRQAGLDVPENYARGSSGGKRLAVRRQSEVADFADPIANRPEPSNCAGR